MIKKISTIISEHKIIAGILIILIIFGGYSGYKAIEGKKGTISYVTSAAEKGTLVVSVSGSGQISSSDQIDIKAKVSGEAIYVGIKNGQEVKKGALLVQLDASDAQKTVRDAEASLASAKLSLEKLIGPEGLSVPKNKESAQDDLKKAYDDEFNTISNAFVDLPAIMTGLQGIVLGYDYTPSQWNIDYYEDTVIKYDENVTQYRDDAYEKYQIARKLYNENFQSYKLIDRYSDVEAINGLANQTYETTRALSDTVKSASNLIQFYKDKLSERNLTSKTLADTQLTSLNTYMSKTNSHLTSLLSAQNSIKNYQDGILNAELDIESQELVIEQKENALSDAKEKLANYFIYAPFAGIITEPNVKKGDSVSGSTVLATLITKQRVAEISLNEVDVANVKPSQKVNLTFDAVSDLNLTGEVADVDTLGTVSQGVVTYNAKIVFDAQDERVKPGMSVSASIIVDAKQDVIIVSNSAIKSDGDTQYVEILKDKKPQSQTVETGLYNDTMIEIVSGIKEGDMVITQTITANSSKTTTQQNSILRIPGVTGGGSFR